MEKSFNLKVSVRISSKCSQVIDQVSFNHLILCGGEHKKYQFDKIYSKSDNNEKLFENILRIPSNLMLEGFCSMIFCLGSPNSGKTYSLAGKIIHSYQQQAEPGIIVYMMRRLFSKFKHEDSLYSTYSFWCKFLFVQKDKLRNLNGTITEKDWQNNNNTKILIKNYSHFEQLISQVYNNNNNSNRCHIIIQLILQKQTPNQHPTTSSVTFVQFGSFFYNCPYRQAGELSMENDIESTLLTIKNLSKISKNQEIFTNSNTNSSNNSSNINVTNGSNNNGNNNNSNIFDSSLLTKLLKNNILKSCSFDFLGILDDSYQNNFKTLNFLDIILHKKQNYGYYKNVKEEIKRQEIYLESLYEKHKRVLNLLSRCIGMELGYLEKQKKKKKFDGPVLNTFYKTCEKIKYANIRKFQNQKVLQQIRKNIDKEKQQLSQIQTQYEHKFKKLENQKNQLINKKKQLQELYQSIINPNIKFSANDNSLYCKYQDDQKSYKRFILQEQQLGFANSGADSQRQSKNDGKSFKMFSSTLQITTRNNIQSRFDTMAPRQKLNQKYQKNNQQEMNILNQRRITQMKRQIGILLKKILDQELEINLQKDKIPLHHNKILNKVKNRNERIQFDLEQAKKCLLQISNNQNSINLCSSYKYKEMLESLITHEKFQKQMNLNNSNGLNSMGAISMKSLKSQKQIKFA